MSSETAAPVSRKKKLIVNIIIIAIVAIFAVGLILNVLCGIEINKTYKNLIKEELKATAEHLASQLNSTWDGDWSYVDDTIYKGEEPVHEEYESLMDELHAQTNVDYTLFWGIYQSNNHDHEIG